MSVDWCGQPIMVKLRLWQITTAEIDSLHHAPGGQNSKHCVEVRIGRYDGIFERQGKGLSRCDINCESLREEQIDHLNKVNIGETNFI